MKLMIASDIHGSRFYLEELVKKFNEFKVDKLALLGDIYYHGPRNPFPKDYDPMGVSKILNDMKDKLIVIKGNCDSEVDQMISDFTFTPMAQVLVDTKVVTLTHGHVFNIDNMPSGYTDVLAYGHFHTNFMIKKDKTLVVNPGSVALPKENTCHGFIIIENNTVTQYTIEGEKIQSESI